MFVNPDVLARGREDNALLAFFLVQRTGSSALTRWLHGEYAKDQVYFYRNVENFIHWKRCAPGALDPYRVYAGFSEYVETETRRPLVAFSLVRHPLYRIASLYEMSKRDKLHVYHELANRTSFEDYYREGSADRPGYFQNLNCLRIANEPKANAAIATMERAFGIVAATDELGEMTRRLCETYGWSIDPLTQKQGDTARYERYMDSPARDEILRANAEDLRLYEHVVGASSAQPAMATPTTNATRQAATAKAPAPAAPKSTPNAALEASAKPAPAQPALAIPASPEPAADAAPRGRFRPCPICGDPLTTLAAGGHCATCKSPARGRTLSTVLERVVGPRVSTGVSAKPLLAFGATRNERKLLEQHFPSIKSVSLYGKYSDDHESGVDARDLSRYADNSFSGAFGILLFDYFPDFDKALGEISRTLTPGGILFSLVLTPRVLSDASEPHVTKTIRSRPGYFEYVPADAPLLNVTVGQDWFLEAIERAGLEAIHMRVLDRASGEVSQWFIGIKPGGPAPGAISHGAAKPAPVKAPPAAPVPAPAPVAAPKPVAAASLAVVSRDPTEAFTQTFTTPVDPAFGFKSVTIKLTIPTLPKEGRSSSFAEHVYSHADKAQSASVIAVRRGGVLVSDDNGATWRVIDLKETAGIDLFNSLTLSDGTHLLQAKSAEGGTVQPAGGLTIFRYARDWTYLGQASPGHSHWHGSRSADEAGGIVMFAEYPDNKDKYKLSADGGDGSGLDVQVPKVFRSKDKGATWQEVFSKHWTEIRHFHTLLADPYRARTWWLSSGDQAVESCVWISEDDGDTWREITNRDPDVVVHPSFQANRQAVQRYTDIWLGENEVLWGSDDWLGGPTRYYDDDVSVKERVGSRMFVSPRTEPLQPRVAGFVGNPIRTLTDVGPALIATTEAKRAVMTRPQVALISKNNPDLVRELFSIDVLRPGGSGFTFSRASRAAKDGTFFSFRARYDLMDSPTRILKWDVSFD